jgi:hypothetical protein
MGSGVDNRGEHVFDRIDRMNRIERENTAFVTAKYGYANVKMLSLRSRISRRSRLISDALSSSSRGRSRRVKPGQSGFGPALAQSGKNFPRVDGLFRGEKAFP